MMGSQSLKMLIAGACLTAMAGCANKANEIAPAYVSPALYNSMSCQQLATEAQDVANRAAHAAAVQDKKASNDAVAVGVATVLFWPAAFMIKGDGASAAEVARLKGEMAAIENANRQKNCGIRFAR